MPEAEMYAAENLRPGMKLNYEGEITEEHIVDL